MPAWSHEVGGPLNEQQIEAVVTLVEGWAAEAAEQPAEEVPDTPEAGRRGLRHGRLRQLPRRRAGGDDRRARTSRPSAPASSPTGLPVEPSGLDQMVADYEEDPRNFLELWIRDSAGNYNDGDVDRHAAAPGGHSSARASCRR